MLTILAAGAVVAVVVVVRLLWFLISGGYFAAFGHWMHESDLGSALRYILESLLLLVCLLLSTAVLIYLERKIWGSVHIRRGPNVVGPWGVLQPFADFGKFIIKEPIIPSSANKGVFVFAPLVSVVLAIAGWAVIPVADGWVVADINVGILYLFAVSSLGVYGIIMAGWASNSKYPLLSALRSAAQMVSYEVSIGFVIVTVLLCAGSLNLSDIVRAQDTRFGLLGWYWLPLLPMFIIFFVSSLAETNRPPFDLTEAESELVAGYQVEYSASLFLLQFLTELVAVLLMSSMTADPVPRRLAVSVAVPAVHLGPGPDLVPDQGVERGVLFLDGEGLRAALSLRPADAPRLEGVPADLAVHGRPRRGRARVHRAWRPRFGLREEERPWRSDSRNPPARCSWPSFSPPSRCRSGTCSSRR